MRITFRLLGIDFNHFLIDFKSFRFLKSIESLSNHRMTIVTDLKDIRTYFFLSFILPQFNVAGVQSVSLSMVANSSCIILRGDGYRGAGIDFRSIDNLSIPIHSLTMRCYSVRHGALIHVYDNIIYCIRLMRKYSRITTPLRQANCKIRSSKSIYLIGHTQILIHDANRHANYLAILNFLLNLLHRSNTILSRANVFLLTPNLVRS